MHEQVFRKEAERQQDEVKLLKIIRAQMQDLEALLSRCTDWGYEDSVYRFYHQSFKVYGVQDATKEMVARLQNLAPHLPLNHWFLEIVEQGSGKQFSMEHNANWTVITRPMLEAFFHARYMLEMICKYGKEFTKPPQIIPSGWAAVLYLYNIR